MSRVRQQNRMKSYAVRYDVIILRVTIHCPVDVSCGLGMDRSLQWKSNCSSPKRTTDILQEPRDSVSLFRAKSETLPANPAADTRRFPGHGFTCYRRTHNNHHRRVKRQVPRNMSSKRTEAPKAGHVEQISTTVLRGDEPKRWSNDNIHGHTSRSRLGREKSFPNAVKWLKSGTPLRLNFHITHMATGHGLPPRLPLPDKEG